MDTVPLSLMVVKNTADYLGYIKNCLFSHRFQNYVLVTKLNVDVKELSPEWSSAPHCLWWHCLSPGTKMPYNRLLLIHCLYVVFGHHLLHFGPHSWQGLLLRVLLTAAIIRQD